MDGDGFRLCYSPKRGTAFMKSDQDFPTEFPIFPLTGAVLYPHTRMPLNIFEPRYLSLIDAVLAGSRYMGMIQPRLSVKETVDSEDGIYEIGCLGRLTAFAETDDGRYVVTLTGVSRYRVVRELPIKDGYRRAEADFSPFRQSAPPQEGATYDRTGFMATLTTYLDKLGADQNQQSFEHANDQALITAVAMSAPFAPGEKQAILECVGLEEQAEMVRSLMEMSAYDNDDETPGLRH